MATPCSLRFVIPIVLILAIAATPVSGQGDRSSLLGTEAPALQSRAGGSIEELHELRQKIFQERLIDLYRWMGEGSQRPSTLVDRHLRGIQEDLRCGRIEPTAVGFIREVDILNLVSKGMFLPKDGRPSGFEGHKNRPIFTPEQMRLIQVMALQIEADLFGSDPALADLQGQKRDSHRIRDFARRAQVDILFAGDWGLDETHPKRARIEMFSKAVEAEILAGTLEPTAEAVGKRIRASGLIPPEAQAEIHSEMDLSEKMAFFESRDAKETSSLRSRLEAATRTPMEKGRSTVLTSVYNGARHDLFLLLTDLELEAGDKTRKGKAYRELFVEVEANRVTLAEAFDSIPEIRAGRLEKVKEAVRSKGGVGKARTRNAPKL